MRRDLVEAAARGDHEAFEVLATSAGDRLLLCWRELPRLRDPERFEVWLYRLLVNACYEEARRHKRWTTRVRVLPMEGPVAPDPIVSVDDRDALERAFQRLSPEHRTVFVMHHYAGLPLATIAEVVGVPVGTVKSRLHNSVRNLRSALTIDSEVGVAEVKTA